MAILTHLFRKEASASGKTLLNALFFFCQLRMDVTGVGVAVEVGASMTPEDELKQRVFYASVRETIVRSWLAILAYYLIAS